MTERTTRRPGAGRRSWDAIRRDPQVGVGLVTAVALVAQAVLAKNVLDVELDVASQFTGLWIFIAYMVSGLRDRASAIAFAAVIVLATAAMLTLYAV